MCIRDSPSVVTDLLKGQLTTTAYIHANPATAQTAANTQLATVTGKALKAPELATAWADMTFTNDPIASSILADLVHAKAAGFKTCLLYTSDAADDLLCVD